MAAIKPDIKLQPIRQCQNNGCLANGMCSYKLYDADVSPALISKVTGISRSQVSSICRGIEPRSAIHITDGKQIH
ncbi:hypothetical protein DPK35_24960 [Salmonella enterica subsp. enterica]|nr:hypothetical protein [Salmonella enterica subsp. enterica serovar Sandiego]